MQTAALADTLVSLARRAADSQPEVNFCFGQVVSESPLQILVEQRLLVPEDELILTEPLIAAVEPVFDTEGNVIKNVYQVFHNLSLEDRVLLARVQGGQAYVIISRYYPTEAADDF